MSRILDSMARIINENNYPFELSLLERNNLDMSYTGLLRNVNNGVHTTFSWAALYEHQSDQQVRETSRLLFLDCVRRMPPRQFEIPIEWYNNAAQRLNGQVFQAYPVSNEPDEEDLPDLLEE